MLRTLLEVRGTGDGTGSTRLSIETHRVPAAEGQALGSVHADGTVVNVLSLEDGRWRRFASLNGPLLVQSVH